MTTNARILRIDRRTSGAADGADLFTTGADLDPAAECFMDGITDSQKWKLDAKVRDATWVCYIEDEALAESGEDAPAVGDQVAIVLDTAEGGGGAGDDGDALTGQVLLAKTLRMASLSHRELYLKIV